MRPAPIDDPAPDASAAGDGVDLGQLARFIELIPVPVTILSADGDHRSVHWDLLRHESSGRVLAIASDRTLERRRLEEERDRTRRDPLTGLLNRFGVVDHLATTTGFDLVAVALDLDRFKVVNDAMGHQAGDTVLQIIADRLRRLLGPGDVAGRLGGDEFLLVVRPAGRTPDEIGATVERLFDDPVRVGRRTFDVGASIGVAATIASTGTDEILHRADIAAYRAKTTGRRCVADVEVIHAWQRSINVESEIREAMAAGRFLPHFQPTVTVGDRRVVGYESLIRWQREDGGLRSAASFIDVAIESGLLAAISARVRRRTFDVAAVRTERFSINLSAPELFDRGLLDELIRLCDRRHIDPDRIMIEITEQDMLDVSGAARILERLAGAGFGISLDDFGAGHSSLGHLAGLPVRQVKLDKQFVAAARDGGRGLDTFVAVVEFVDRLGLTCLVEGIETEDDHRLVSDLAVPLAQGYLYGRPVSADDLPFDGAASVPITPAI